MRLKRPFEYDIKPNKLNRGDNWITVDLKNMSADVLSHLDIQLHSLDSLFINVYNKSSYITEIQPKDIRSIPSHLQVNGNARLYVTITGYRDGVYFFWETPVKKMQIRSDIAEIQELFILTHPYTAIGKTIEVEAILKAIKVGKKLELSFWVDTKNETMKKIADIETKELEEGEEIRYSVEFTPRKEGIHEIYAYLYDGNKILGRKTNTMYVQKA